jgi:hypothetical protein
LRKIGQVPEISKPMGIRCPSEKEKKEMNKIAPVL